MVFVFINIVTFVIVLMLSLSIDRTNKVNKNSNSLVNMLLFLSAVLVLMTVTTGLYCWGPTQLALIMAKFTYTLAAWLSVNACVYALLYPHQRKHRVVTIIKWILNLGAFYLMFVQKRGLYRVGLYNGILTLDSGYIFDKAFIQITDMRWLDFFKYIYFFIIPFLAFIMILVRAENTKTKLEKQAHLLNAAGIFASWMVMIFLRHGCKIQSMMETLLILAFVPEILCFVKANSTEDIWDGSLARRTTIRILLNDILPAVALGCIFAFIYPLLVRYPLLLIGAYIICVAIFGVIWMLLGKLFAKKGFLNDSRYADRFEKEMAQLDFESGSPMEITGKVFELFKKNVNSSSMKILIDAGSNNFETIYASDGENVSIKIDSSIFDTLLGNSQTIVFRETVERKSSLVNIRPHVLEVLNAANADAMIILNEGRQIISVIFLGKKITQNAYSEYDYNVFNKVYSNLFVVAYYVKNIMNEDVVGTVNREINMSGQIITSIQENMDFIKNPKVDAGYEMIPAHNIGGEFVDMIRLSDTRHMFVVGALSGKGIAASMSMIILKSIIRTFLAETKDFKLLVQKVNSFIRESLPRGTYFAGTFGLIDFTTDTLYYINCGTAGIFLYTRAYNNVIEIQGEGHVLGFAKDISSLVKVKKVKLAAGDVVLACTDGLVETKSLRGEEFGRSRIQNCMIENLSYPSEKIAKFTYDALVDFTSKALDDDITILVLKYLGGNE